MARRESEGESALERAYEAAGHAVGTVGRIGTHAVRTALRLPGLGRPHARVPRRIPGAPPGFESIAAEAEETTAPAEPVAIECIDYSRSRMERQTVDELEAFLKAPRPDWAEVRWINVVGLDADVVERLHQSYEFHTLAAEDVLHVPQRPRVEPYPSHLFVVARMLLLQGEHLASEQVSMFLFESTLLTFQEKKGDVWDPLRSRLEREGSRLRTNDASFLLYALLDALVDHLFPILEHYGEHLDQLEETILESSSPNELRRVQNLRRELVLLRKVMWPTRQLLDELHRGELPQLSKTTKLYLRDVYSHTVQILDVVESYREMAGGLSELYMSVVSNRMNEIMKVLTIMASIFIPITFIAGVYGMNFEHIPELSWYYAYPAFWGLCAAVSLGLLAYFRHRGWLG